MLADSQSRNVILENQLKEKDSVINSLTTELKLLKESNEKSVEELANKHNEKIDVMKEKSEFQKQKAVLELQLKHQNEIEELNRKSNQIVGDYQAKYKELLEELEHIRNSSTKKSTTKISANKKSKRGV